MNLLAGIGARRYSKPEQLYLLADACMKHLVICVQFVRASGAPPGGHVGSYVLSHLLSPTSPLWRELMSHVVGATANLQPLAVDTLTMLVEASVAGQAAEDAVATVFDLMNTVLDGDLEWVDARRKQQHIVEPLHSLIMKQPVWALQLVQFLQYSGSASIQLGAVRLVGFLSTRDASFTHMILRFPQHARKLVYDCALCLADNLYAAADDGSNKGTAGVAALLLRVLLDNATLPTPNLTHLLLGYPVLQVRCLSTNVLLVGCHIRERG
jgi:nuclear pore complex protein Nup205